MKYIGLDNKEYKINLKQYAKPKDNGSDLHEKSRQLLQEEFPGTPILEEVYIESEKMYLDFFLPILSICVEAQGEQHFKHTKHFHNTNLAFNKAKRKDEIKKEWCQLNAINLVYFNYNEDISEWKKKLYL